MNHFVLNFSKDKLASAPEFRGTEELNARYANQVYSYFGVRPYWWGARGTKSRMHSGESTGESTGKPSGY